MIRPCWPGDDGSAVALAGVGLAMTMMILVVTVDAGSYLLAASRAQSLADGAALAAAVAVADGRSGPAAADRVARAGDGTLISCACDELPVHLEVAVAVAGLIIPTVAAGEVTAASSATVVADGGFGVGPGFREMSAQWPTGRFRQGERNTKRVQSLVRHNAFAQRAPPRWTRSTETRPDLPSRRPNPVAGPPRSGGSSTRFGAASRVASCCPP
ncbi:MAG: hypothetical protein R3249_11255 [Nitriliruptorales bacterium]|nr:hypothetical protein [Nitriliruptorales bacterium]